MIKLNAGGNFNCTELHSAVAQIFNLLRARKYQGYKLYQRSAEYNSAIQQSATLRYDFEASTHI